MSQHIDLPGVGVVLVNEQILSASANEGGITVNALHIMLLGPGGVDVVIAQAHADIRCGLKICPLHRSRHRHEGARHRRHRVRGGETSRHILH